MVGLMVTLAALLANGCEPGRMPSACEMFGVRIADSEQATGMPYLCLIGVNWLRHRNDTDGWHIHVIWQYPTQDCRIEAADELLGDLNADGRVDLADFAIYVEYRPCGQWHRMP